MKKLYIDTGYKDGKKKILAYKDCSCGGRGYTARDINRNILVPCKCIRIIDLPISWMVFG